MPKGGQASTELLHFVESALSSQPRVAFSEGKFLVQIQLASQEQRIWPECTILCSSAHKPHHPRGQRLPLRGLASGSCESMHVPWRKSRMVSKYFYV